MSDKSILNKPRLPIIYELEKDIKIINPFHERFSKFESPYDEFVDVCYNNLTFAVFSLMKWKGGPLSLAPFQSVILQTLWDKTFPILLASRGGSKTFLLAIYALLRAILVPGSKIVIVAASFRQSKLVFDYIEQIHNYSPIIQATTTKIARPNDAREMIIGTSSIRALPLGNGEKIRGVRACVSADTLVDTKFGLIEARDIVECDKDFPIFNGDDFETPSHYCRTDTTNVHRVETTYGLTIEFSDIHRLMTDDGWKDIEDLTTDDRIIIHSSKEFPLDEAVPPSFEKYNECRNDYVLPISVNTNVAKILGYLVSEGCVTKKGGTIGFTNTETELINDYCNIFEETFGVRPAVYKKSGFIDKRGWKCKKSYEARICRKGIRDYLYKCGLGYSTARGKVIPQSMLRSPKNVTISFLRTLFEGDGTAVLYKNSKRQTDEFYIAYYSASRKLCSQLQILLLKFGLIGSLSERSKGNNNFYLRLSKGCATAFAKDVGFISKRKIAICDEAIKMFTPKYYGGRSVKIKKIERNTRKDVLYDVCMPNTHRFVANGIMNHNSDILVDEYASIPEEIFQVVVRGFAAVSSDPIEQARQIHMEDVLIKQGKLSEEDRGKISSNKIIYSGTASYQFNHFYRLYSIHKAIIENKFTGSAEDINESFQGGEDEDRYKLEGNLDYRDYAIIQIPYMALPKGFMDDKQILQARATMPRALFSMEYECIFATDSDGFFKRTLINEATPGLDGNGKSFSIELVGDPNYEYVMGVDPARKTDNFSISILKLMNDGKGYRNVYCYSMNNKNWITSVRKIRDLLSKFNIVRMAVDSGGGGTTVEDLLQNKEILNRGEPPVWRYNDDEHLRFDGLHILDMVNFSPSWIGEANYGLAADIEHRRLKFPHRDKDTSIDVVSGDAIIKDVLYEPWYEVEEQINELCKIIVTATKTGVQHFDLPNIPTAQQTKISTTQRKDRYSALLLSSYAAKSYISEGQMTFAPFMGNWIEYI